MASFKPLQQAPNLTINALMQATLRMSDLLGEEAKAIAEMRFKDLATLHEEKLQLTRQLESFQQVMAKDPGFVKNADAKDREELLLLTDDLAFSVEDNYRKVSVAKAVNARIMQAMMDVMTERHRPGTYGANGMATSPSDLALSMNLNQRA